MMLLYLLHDCTKSKNAMAMGLQPVTYEMPMSCAPNAVPLYDIFKDSSAGDYVY